MFYILTAIYFCVYTHFIASESASRWVTQAETRRTVSLRMII